MCSLGVCFGVPAYNQVVTRRSLAPTVGADIGARTHPHALDTDPHTFSGSTYVALRLMVTVSAPTLLYLDSFVVINWDIFEKYF